MSENGLRPAGIPQSLGRLRLRLTAWYVGTFLAILLLLGIGLFATVTARFDSELDASLNAAAHNIAAVVRSRGVDAAASSLIIPERRLLVFDSAGHPLGGANAEAWLVEFAARVARGAGTQSATHADGERILRADALPFEMGQARLVAMAVADEIEIEDKYASLIAVSGAAALAALMLVGAGGWIVARQSTLPVERAVAHMRRFMADAAHELRTPLSVVRSRADVALQRPRAAAEYEAALRGIEAESARIGRIVEDLLMLARADAGERPIERQRVFLDDVVLDAAEAARALAIRKNVRVDVTDFDEAPVIGDAALLRQLALILLDNAIKFSSESGVVVVGVSQTGAGASLTVSDEGTGIPAEQLPHVFERFYRGDTARTRAGQGASEGAGLGLSIAHWIVDEHAATIRIDSEHGRGTRVAVQFPAVTTDQLSSS